jgi:hypothetical protein
MRKKLDIGIYLQVGRIQWARNQLAKNKDGDSRVCPHNYGPQTAVRQRIIFRSFQNLHDCMQCNQRLAFEPIVVARGQQAAD